MHACMHAHMHVTVQPRRTEQSEGTKYHRVFFLEATKMPSSPIRAAGPVLGAAPNIPKFRKGRHTALALSRVSRGIGSNIVIRCCGFTVTWICVAPGGGEGGLSTNTTM